MVRQVYTPLLWALPGGRVKHRETPLEAFKREVHEEVRIKLAFVKELGSQIFRHEYKEDHVTFFKAEVPRKEVAIDHYEILEAEWFPLHGLPSNVGPVTQTGLSLMQNDPFDTTQLHPERSRADDHTTIL